MKLTEFYAVPLSLVIYYFTMCMVFFLFLKFFNLGLKMDRKLKTVNTLKLREMLRRRFTSYTSLTLAWEMMECTLLLPQTVGERVARLQNFMYIVSRVTLTMCIICWYCHAPLLLLKSSHKLLLPAGLCSKPCQYSKSCMCKFGGCCCSLLDRSLWLALFSIVLDLK